MLHLAYGPAVIAVEGPAPALVWLREFLGAAFEEASAPPHHTLRLEIGPLGAEPGAPAEPVELFSLDGDFVRLPGRRAPDGALLAFDDGQGLRYLFRDGQLTIRAREDDPASRLALLRSAREIVTAHALRRGDLHFHAAAVAGGRGVAAISGPRGSGKTTLLLHLLLGGGLRYVTNDRLLVDVQGDPPLARGMSTIVSLRKETLDRFPAFARRLGATAYSRERTIAESDALPAGRFRPNLSPAQFRALAGAEECGSAPLRSVVFPSVRPDVDGFAIRALAPEEAAPLVRRGLLLATLPERPAAAFALGAPARDAGALDRACREISARIPCVELHLGRRAYEGAALMDAIHERL